MRIYTRSRMKSRLVWHNGELVTFESATVSALAHGLQRGSGVFDVGSFATDAEGRLALFRVRDHLQRFERSHVGAGLVLRWDEETLVQATREVVKKSGFSRGLIRWSGAVSSMQRDVVPADPETDVTIFVDESRPRAQSYRVAVYDDMIKAPGSVFPPTLKVGAAYFGPMLARRRALSEGFDEVVLRDADGFLAEAPTANVFFVRNGELYTPPLGSILPGITRTSVMALAESLSVRVHERPLSGNEPLEEAFLTATSYPLMPISEIVGMRRTAPGPLTQQLQALFACAEVGKIFRNWIDYV